MSEELTITIKKENVWKYSTFVLAAVVVVLILIIMTGGNVAPVDNSGSQGTVGQVKTTQDGANTLSVDFKKVIVANTPVIGKADAPVTILEFSDFSCPFCAAASGDNPEYVAYMKQRQPSWEPPVSNVINDYAKTGKVRFAAFYMKGHSGGQPAQTVAWCLNEQKSDLYWAFYAKAFANISDVEDSAKMRTLAQSIAGVDMTKLDACIKSDKFSSRFAEEQAKGNQLSLSGTPGFIIGKSDGSEPAVIIKGAYPYSNFKQVIDSYL